RVKMKSEFGGRLENLSVVTGQYISAGSPLLRIEDEKLPLELNRQRVELQEAEAQLELNTRLALSGGSEEEREEEFEGDEEGEMQDEASTQEFPSDMEPTFAQLASRVHFTPVDAGGIW